MPLSRSLSTHRKGSARAATTKTTRAIGRAWLISPTPDEQLAQAITHLADAITTLATTIARDHTPDTTPRHESVTTLRNDAETPR